MPMLKKRSGKATITLYADEQRDIQGTIEVMNFLKVNAGDPIKSKASELSAGLNAVMQIMATKNDNKQTDVEKPL